MNATQRLFLDQADAMARLKGKTGQPHVTVEHVTVTAGGPLRSAA